MGWVGRVENMPPAQWGFVIKCRGFCSKYWSEREKLDSENMGIACKWLQLLLICRESGLFSCTYWFSFISFLKEEAFCTNVSLGLTSGVNSSSPQLFLVTSLRERLQRSRSWALLSLHWSQMCEQLWGCFCSPTVNLSFAPLFSAWHSSNYSGCHQGGIFLPFQAFAGWCGSVEQETVVLVTVC